MLNTPQRFVAGLSNHAHNSIFFVQKQFCQIRTILAGNAGYQNGFGCQTAIPPPIIFFSVVQLKGLAVYKPFLVRFQNQAT